MSGFIKTRIYSKASNNSGGASIPNASDTVAGKVQKATQQQVDDGTTTGSTGAELFVNPAELKSNLGWTGVERWSGTASSYQQILLLTTVPINSVVNFEIYIEGVTAAGADGYAGKVRAGVRKNSAGTVTMIAASVQEVFNGAVTATVTIPGANQITLSVSGVAAAKYTAFVKYRILTF